MNASAEAIITRSSGSTSLFTDQSIREIASGGAGKIAAWAQSTASERGIRVRRMPNEEFVKAVSRLSDGIVDLDPVEQLLVALGRAGVISSFQRGLLQLHYLR